MFTRAQSVISVELAYSPHGTESVQTVPYLLSTVQCLSLLLEAELGLSQPLAHLLQGQPGREARGAGREETYSHLEGQYQ